MCCWTYYHWSIEIPNSGWVDHWCRIGSVFPSSPFFSRRCNNGTIAPAQYPSPPFRPIFSSLIFSLLFGLLILLLSSILAPLLFLSSSPLRYSFSTLIYHVFLHLSSLRYTPIRSYNPPQLCIVNSYQSTNYPLYLLLSVLHFLIGLDWIGLDQLSLAHLDKLFSVFCSSGPYNLS